VKTGLVCLNTFRPINGRISLLLYPLHLFPGCPQFVHAAWFFGMLSGCAGNSLSGAFPHLVFLPSFASANNGKMLFGNEKDGRTSEWRMSFPDKRKTFRITAGHG
jgi:hypothetical protein